MSFSWNSFVARFSALTWRYPRFVTPRLARTVPGALLPVPLLGVALLPDAKAAAGAEALTTGAKVVTALVIPLVWTAGVLLLWVDMVVLLRGAALVLRGCYEKQSDLTCLLPPYLPHGY